MENILKNMREGLRKIVAGRESDIPLLYSHNVEPYESLSNGDGYRIHLAYRKEEGSYDLVQLFLRVIEVNGVYSGHLSINGYGNADRSYENIDHPLLEPMYGYAENLIVDNEELDLDAISKIMKTDIDLTNDNIDPHNFT
jgi:hypothetical protein